MIKNHATFQKLAKKRASLGEVSYLDYIKYFKKFNVRDLKFNNYSDMRQHFKESGYYYFVLAAASRKKTLDPSIRNRIVSDLFEIRAKLENNIIKGFDLIQDTEDLHKRIFSNSLLGKSKKQGLSIRYPLSSCQPTETCGGLCYAHDGRDKHLETILRGCLNFYLGRMYERSTLEFRDEIIVRLGKVLRHGVDFALKEQGASHRKDFTRQARIRFSHVGDMAAHLNFTNRLADEIGTISNKSVQCVIYTRHANAKGLSEKFVINFSIDNDKDERMKLAPKRARLVSSAWEGKVSRLAKINFLEHHNGNKTIPVGTGSICPITLANNVDPSCDEVKCDKCFVDIERDNE
jgi:hypothetical protein